MKKKISPMLIILISFVGIALLGSLLLSLPIAHENEGLTYVDALFLSVSSVCVTGLNPVANIATVLSTFGKVVVALLIQIGGLGFVTIAIFVLTMIGAKIGTVERYLVRDALNQTNSRGMVKLVRDIVLITLIIEFVGAVLNLFVFIPALDYNISLAIGVSIFHSISSFNNCGLDIIGFGNSLENPLLSDNILLNINTSVLIFLGGIGFIVIRDIIANKRWSKFSTHTKIVLKVSIILIITGTIALYLSEMGDPTFHFHHAFFQSIGARTAGFSTFSFTSLNSISVVIMIFLMFIGASPSSTGGGIKTTTFYVIVKSFFSFAKGKKTLVFGREITNETKIKAFLLTVFAMSMIFLGTIGILSVEHATNGYFIESSGGEHFLTVGKAMFEATSAFSTVGYSIGVTMHLHWISKLILCVIMFVGRLGPLTVLSIWNKKWNIESKDDSITYVEEKIIIG